MKVNSPAIHRGVLLFKSKVPYGTKDFYRFIFRPIRDFTILPHPFPTINRGVINFCPWRDEKLFID